MSVLVDSSVIVAFLHQRDRHHAAAVRLLSPILSGGRGLPAVTDYLIDEVLTFLVARGASARDLDKAIGFLVGDGEVPGPFVIHRVGVDHFSEAVTLLRRHRDRRMSFTDCTSLSIMRSHGIAAIASFDKDFDGLVMRLAA